MQNGCDLFARFDSYYVNWTFPKIWHFGKIDLWFDLIWTKNDLDLIWLFVIWFLIWGFDLNHFCKWFVICTCDLICDLPITGLLTNLLSTGGVCDVFYAWRSAALMHNSDTHYFVMFDDYFMQVPISQTTQSLSSCGLSASSRIQSGSPDDM